MCYSWQIGEPGSPHADKKMILDPYAPAVAGSPEWGQSLVRQPEDLVRGGPAFPKGVIVDSHFDWGQDRCPDIPLSEMVVYETHVRGFTAGPASNVESPGTYRGMIEKIPYLKSLGITSIELLPMFEFDEMEYFHQNDRRSSLKNYWGYSTLGFFAPMSRYAASGNHGQQVDEFKELVKAIHAAGMEVILDVVYNHTVEGGEGGPVLHFKALGQEVYYLLTDEGEFQNQTGCGNTVNCNHPVVRSFILDSLRHWVMEYHIDGFRFDLAPVLCRGRDGALMESPPLIEEIDEDPVLRNTKMIAEAWDAAGAYQVGSFPSHRWLEWNGRYRDDIRRFWSGEPGTLSAFATRVLGSEDLYAGQPLGAAKSVNFVCCHDGFTLRDLVSYRDKHNEANLENNQDGEKINHSTNCGVEGETLNPEINELRTRMQKNFLATLFVSRGIPMIQAGDEMGKTQHGNNNAYCQDNELSWIDWTDTPDRKDLITFVKKLRRLRATLPALSFDGLVHDTTPELAAERVHWIGPEHRGPNWKEDQAVGLRLSGKAHCLNLEEDSEDVLIFFNASRHSVRFTLPDTDHYKWKMRAYTTAKRVHRSNLGTSLLTKPHSVVIFSAKAS
jgi:glycogen operon protein